MIVRLPFVFMNKLTIVALLIIALSGQVVSQLKPVAKFAAENELAKLTVAAHGGEKLRAMKSLVLRGSVDITTSAFNQAIPATFVVIFAKEKYRFEIANPFQPIKEVFDGVNKSTTIRGGFTLPPVNRLGFPVLAMIGEPGFIITGLPQAKAKMKGFRVTSPEGFFTDFYIDEKTNRLKGYDSKYDINNRIWTTAVEIDKLREIDGIFVPEKYAQRFDTEQLTVYADFKAKEILVNSQIADDVFSVGQ